MTGMIVKTYDRYVRRNPVFLYFHSKNKSKRSNSSRRRHEKVDDDVYSKRGWHKVYNSRNMRKFKKAIEESNPDGFFKSLDKWTMLLYGIHHELVHSKVPMDFDFCQGNWIITCLLIRGLYYKTLGVSLQRLFEEAYDEYLLHAVVGLPSGLLPKRFVDQILVEYDFQAFIKEPIRERLPLAIAVSVGATREMTDQLMMMNPYAISQPDADGLVPEQLLLLAK